MDIVRALAKRPFAVRDHLTAGLFYKHPAKVLKKVTRAGVSCNRRFIEWLKLAEPNPGHRRAKVMLNYYAPEGVTSTDTRVSRGENFILGRVF